METFVVIAVLAVLVAGRVYLGHLAAEAYDSLPEDQKARMRRMGAAY